MGQLEDLLESYRQAPAAERDGWGKRITDHIKELHRRQLRQSMAENKPLELAGNVRGGLVMEVDQADEEAYDVGDFAVEIPLHSIYVKSYFIEHK